MQLLSAYGANNPVVVSLNTGSTKLNLKNVPKKWNHEVEHLLLRTEAVGVSKYLDIHDHNLASVLSDCNSRKSLRWRNHRSYLLSNQVQIEAQPSTDDHSSSSSGRKYRVSLQGCLRGVPLYAHSLVHICGVGTGRIVRVRQAGSNGDSDNVVEADPSK